MQRFELTDRLVNRTVGLALAAEPGRGRGRGRGHVDSDVHVVFAVFWSIRGSQPTSTDREDGRTRVKDDAGERESSTPDPGVAHC